MYLQPEFMDLYGEQTISEQLNQLYLNLFNRNGDDIGLSYWINQINTKSLQLLYIANDLIWAAENNPESTNKLLTEPTQSNIDKFTGLKTNLANDKTFKMITNEINSVSHEISSDYSLLDINYKNFVYNSSKKVLDREPDSIGVDYWLGQLSSGTEKRYEVLLGSSEYSENKGLFSDMTFFC